MNKKCAVLFSGGKDSTYAAYLAKQKGYELTCLISILSENKENKMIAYQLKNKLEHLTLVGYNKEEREYQWAGNQQDWQRVENADARFEELAN